MNQLKRRDAIVLLAVTSAAAGGCDQRQIAETTAEIPTDVLENTRVGLRGFQIVAFMAGKRLVQLPHPAVRILGVALLTSGIATFLVVEYLDIELKRRTIREELEDQERAAIESEQAVEFVTENGLSETVALGPNQYDAVEPE